MCGLSLGELVVIAIVLAFVVLVFRRKWLVGVGRTPWSRKPKRSVDRDDPRIQVKVIERRRPDDDH